MNSVYRFHRLGSTKKKTSELHGRKFIHSDTQNRQNEVKYKAEQEIYSMQ
jgi:hypothetical protein